MTGPEHYREAEELLRDLHDGSLHDRSEGAQVNISEAQVHATLALTAATVHSGGVVSIHDSMYESWKVVLS